MRQLMVVRNCFSTALRYAARTVLFTVGTYLAGGDIFELAGEFIGREDFLLRAALYPFKLFCIFPK